MPCGCLHRGPVDRPTGSGPWLIVVGHTPTLNAYGIGVRFSRLNFDRRWMVDPIGGDAYRSAPDKGWGAVVDSLR